MIDAVITEALGRGDVAVADTREAARSVVAQLEGQVLFAKLYNNTSQLSTPLCVDASPHLSSDLIRRTDPGAPRR